MMGLIIAATDVIDWLIPRMLPWMERGALREMVAIPFVQQKEAKHAAAKKKKRKETGPVLNVVNNRKKARMGREVKRIMPGK